jgi:hypothetical protein
MDITQPETPHPASALTDDLLHGLVVGITSSTCTTVPSWWAARKPEREGKGHGSSQEIYAQHAWNMLETWNHQSNHDQWGVFKGIQYLTTNHGNTIVISWDMLSNEILNPHSESGNCFLFLLPSPDIVRKTWMLRLVIHQWIEMGGSNQKTWGLNQPLKKKNYKWLSTTKTQNAKRTFWNACSERKGVFSGFMDPRSVRILFVAPCKKDPLCHIVFFRKCSKSS